MTWLTQPSTQTRRHATHRYTPSMPLGSLACVFGNTPPCRCGWFGFYGWFVCRGGRLQLGGTSLGLGVTSVGGRRSAFVRAKVGVLGLHFWMLRLEERVLSIPPCHFLLHVHGGFVDTSRLDNIG